MRAVLYARVSTKEQASNLSLPTQLEACQRYCSQNSFSIAETFVEEGESAKTADRPQFQRMLSYCKKHRVDFVIVYALNRFARDTADHHAIRAILHHLGIKLRSVTEPIDESSSGKLMEGILSAFAQFDNDVRSERTEAGMRAASERGLWVWQPPIGYLAAGKGVLKVDPDRAPLIRRGFELVADGVAEKAALEVMTRAGLRTIRGRVVAKQTWSRALRNPLYAGRVVVDKWGIDTKGSHEAIVDSGLFSSVQLVLKGRSPKVSLDRFSFPLRRFAQCGSCGEPMTGGLAKGRSKRYAYYWCRKGCKGTNTRLERFHELFMGLLDSLRPAKETMALLAESIRRAWREKAGDVETQTGILNRRLETLEAQRQRLVEAYVLEERIDETMYDSLLRRSNDEKLLIENDLRALKRSSGDIDGCLEFAEAVVMSASRLWRMCSADLRERLQWAIMPQGVVFQAGGFLNRVTSPVFRDLGSIYAHDNVVVYPTGRVLNHPTWIEPLSSLKQDLPQEVLDALSNSSG